MAYGEVIQVIGPSVDIRFPEKEVPRLLNAVKIEDAAKKLDITLEVTQIIGNNTVRCIAMSSTEGLSRGMKAKDLDSPITVPVGPQTLGRIFNVLGQTIDGKGEIAHPEAREQIHRDSPTFEEPTKVTPTVPGWVIRASPTPLPDPCKRLATPFGKPQSSAISKMRVMVMGQSRADLTIVVFPAARAQT